MGVIAGNAVKHDVVWSAFEEFFHRSQFNFPSSSIFAEQNSPHIIHHRSHYTRYFRTMAMIQQEASSSQNKEDSLHQSSNEALTMKETTNPKEQPSQATQESVSEVFSHYSISDSNHPPETRPKVCSTASLVEDTNQIEPTHQSLTTITDQQEQEEQEEERNMKLIVRSQYWGRTLKGKTCRPAASLNRAYRTISCQAVLYNTDEYWGCCPHHGKRVLELQECHFQDAMPDQNWDLYSTMTWVSPNYCINDFFLLPQNQNVIDVSRNIMFSGWAFVGTCDANRIRDDLDGMLSPWLSENENYGYRHHHVHIEIMMDKAFDRETPRSRKVNNEKARQERQQQQQEHTKPKISSTQESSEATDETCSSEPSATGNPFVLRSSTVQGSAAPPIPHVISNDSSSVFSHSVASSAVAYHEGYLGDTMSFWSPPAPPGMNPAPPTMSVPSVQHTHPGMQWHPGSNHPMTTPVHHHPTYHMSWPSHSGLPPPPPPLHGQIPSISHHPLSELQQYLMYSDPLTSASAHNLGHHPHPYYHNPAAAHHHLQTPYSPSPVRVPNRMHVPMEILSTPTSAVSTLMSPTSAPSATSTALQSHHLATSNDEKNINPSVGPAIPSDDATELEKGVASLSISNKESVDTVVTTVARNTMVSSTCWSKSAATNGNSPPSNMNGRLRLPIAD
jgi:hypothetical protein